MTRFFCPGRTELAGSHTDHQRGRVMAAAIDKGISAEAAPNRDGVIRVKSDSFPTVEVALDRLWPDEKEVGTATALVRGMAAVLGESIPNMGGFDAYFFNDLPFNRSLASSSAFSVLVGYILSDFYRDEPLQPEELARAAQKAENRWFGKSSGLMAPLTCAMGNGVYMDVLENKILSIDCNFDALGLALCLTDTGEDPAPAASVCAQIAEDMTAVAQTFGEPFLAMVRGPLFEERWPEHQSEIPWMRARHFMDETFRVASMADALGLRDGQRYMELMNDSGRSAERFLHNTYAEDCGAALARGLMESERLLAGQGAWRVHGGGCAGCIQALMPEAAFEPYRAAMDGLFGAGRCQRVHVSRRGVCRADEDKALFSRDSRGFPESAKPLLG